MVSSVVYILLLGLLDEFSLSYCSISRVEHRYLQYYLFGFVMFDLPIVLRTKIEMININNQIWYVFFCLCVVDNMVFNLPKTL